MEKKRTNRIVAVTIARFATMYIEANTPEEAVKYAKRYCDEVDNDEFYDSTNEVHSWEPRTTTAEDSYADEIWVEDGRRMKYDDYIDALDMQDELEELEKLEEFNKRQQVINF